MQVCRTILESHLWAGDRIQILGTHPIQKCNFLQVKKNGCAPAPCLVHFAAQFPDAIGGHATGQFQPDPGLSLGFPQNYQQIYGFRCVFFVFPHAPCLATAGCPAVVPPMINKASGGHQKS